MNYTCYFCQTELRWGPNDAYWLECDLCVNEDHITQVKHMFNRDDELEYVFIHCQLNDTYIVTLNMRLNYTDVRKLGTIAAVTFPNFPLTPQNSYRKIPIYLLFS